MPSTVPASFEKFRENLEITGLQRSTVSTRQQDIREAIENGMNVADSFLTGSYIRQTMIAPLNKADIDIFMVLNTSHYVQNGQQALLNELRRILRLRYPNTPEISPNGQAVTITFTDFKVDVVPAFNRIGGGYVIPNAKDGSWISTNPQYHVEYKSAHNNAHNGTLVPMIKMLKCWNRQWGNPFESFYLELLAIKIFHGVTITDYPSGARFFFDKGREAIKYKIQDPVGYGGQIGGLKNINTVDAAVRLFQSGYELALSAEQWDRLGFYTKTAIDEWRKVFGDYFPAYTAAYSYS